MIFRADEPVGQETFSRDPVVSLDQLSAPVSDDLERSDGLFG
jgi:hypothetical protein